MKILIVYYSMYGHIHRMAEAAAEGAKSVPKAEVALRRVPETLSQEILAKMGALEAQQTMGHVPICTVDELASADAVIFGTPTRFGNMCGQMRQFLDATGQLWARGALHQGFVIVGLPYSFQGQMRNDEITGGSPYGASTIAGTQGERKRFFARQPRPGNKRGWVCGCLCASVAEQGFGRQPPISGRFCG